MENKKLGLHAEILDREISKDEIGSALTEASLGLAFASKLHEGGAHREAFRISLITMIDFFSGCGFPRHQLEPSGHLNDALGDLDRGTIDPALEPKKITNRRTEPSAEWKARAFLALALEARVRLGESIESAGSCIASNLPISNDLKLSRTEQRSRLVNWREKFNRQRVPEGPHRHIFAVGVAKIEKANASANRADALAKAADTFVALAARHRTRGRP